MKFDFNSFSIERQIVSLLTFSPPLIGREGELVELVMVAFAAGKRSRFNRIGLVLSTGGLGFDDINRRLVIEGAEHGNGISIREFTINKEISFFFDICVRFVNPYLFLYYYPARLNHLNQYHYLSYSLSFLVTIFLHQMKRQLDARLFD